MSLEFHQFPCLSDNYGVLVHDDASNTTISVDAPDAGAVRDALAEKGWSLTHILVTHHHADHTQGVAELKEVTGCTVIGPDNPAIAGVDRALADGDALQLAGDTVSVIATPGHTLDMLNYHFVNAGVLFAADTLFALGCGRVFEGTPQMMWDSLSKLAKLPPQTIVYCGHEYTQANAKFSLTVDGGNKALLERARQIDAMRARGEPTVPTTIALELETNPFLRAGDPQIRKNLGMEDASDAEVFTEIRERKNNA